MFVNYGNTYINADNISHLRLIKEDDGSAAVLIYLKGNNSTYCGEQDFTFTFKNIVDAHKFIAEMDKKG